MDCVASLHPTPQAWLRDSALAPHVDAYAEHLRKGRYATNTTSRYLSCISHFAHWTTARRSLAGPVATGLVAD